MHTKPNSGQQQNLKMSVCLPAPKLHGLSLPSQVSFFQLLVISNRDPGGALVGALIGLIFCQINAVRYLRGPRRERKKERKKEETTAEAAKKEETAWPAGKKGEGGRHEFLESLYPRPTRAHPASDRRAQTTPTPCNSNSAPPLGGQQHVLPSRRSSTSHCDRPGGPRRSFRPQPLHLSRYACEMRLPTVGARRGGGTEGTFGGPRHVQA
jgi:hypothetical protein